MKASEIREWDNVEIQARLQELQEEKFRLRFKLGTMALENPKMVQHIRRDVARLNTILREREAPEKTEMSDGAPTAPTATPTAPTATPTATPDATPPEATDETADEATDETPETEE